MILKWHAPCHTLPLLWRLILPSAGRVTSHHLSQLVIGMQPSHGSLDTMSLNPTETSGGTSLKVTPSTPSDVTNTRNQRYIIR
ncbi:putative 4-hydroxy-2-oxoglutarate aldolase [Fusarium oxysporum f. sp. albedinis]|nr:putative 4-hydroxy-2-oxoglutarate aldolase [Fusarium oxysporum f. sp. albedinis]